MLKYSMPSKIMTREVKLLSIEHLTHDVLRIKTEKPAGLTFIPGQAMKISMDKKDKQIPFTLTSLPDDDFLEFVVKTYPGEQKAINQMLNHHPGEMIRVHEPIGGIHYKGEGVFIAGGSGVAPFIAIFRLLEKQGKVGRNKLLFGNKTEKDIILKDCFESLLGHNFINVLSDENKEGYEHGFIDADLIKKYSEENLRYYYLCGPDVMVKKLVDHLHSLGVHDNFIIKEKF